MPSAQASLDLFPPTLESIPEDEHVEQCFGWTYGYLGVLAIAASLGAVYAGAWKALSDAPSFLGLLIGLALAGPLLLWWEFRRRARRTTLIARDGVIGIYRGGQFILTMRPDEMLIEHSLRPAVLRAVVGLPIMNLVFLALPFVDHNFWPSGVFGVLLLIGLVSGARSTFMLVHCVVAGPKYPQDLMLDKNQIRSFEESLTKMQGEAC